MGKFFKSAQYAGMQNITAKKQSIGSTTSEGSYLDLSTTKTEKKINPVIPPVEEKQQDDQYELETSKPAEIKSNTTETSGRLSHKSEVIPAQQTNDANNRYSDYTKTKDTGQKAKNNEEKYEKDLVANFDGTKKGVYTAGADNNRLIGNTRNNAIADYQKNKSVYDEKYKNHEDYKAAKTEEERAEAVAQLGYADKRMKTHQQKDFNLLQKNGKIDKNMTFEQFQEKYVDKENSKTRWHRDGPKDGINRYSESNWSGNTGEEKVKIGVKEAHDGKTDRSGDFKDSDVTTTKKDVQTRLQKENSSLSKDKQLSEVDLNKKVEASWSKIKNGDETEVEAQHNYHRSDLAEKKKSIRDSKSSSTSYSVNGQNYNTQEEADAASKKNSVTTKEKVYRDSGTGGYYRGDGTNKTPLSTEEDARVRRANQKN